MRRTFTTADIQEVQLMAEITGVEAVWAMILFKNCTKAVPFYAAPTANNDLGKELYVRFKAGEYGEIRFGMGEPFITEPKQQDQIEDAVIEQRNQLLLETDWTEFPSRQASMSDAQKTAWANYRQALRDITKQPSFPWEPQWPSKP